MRLIGTAAPDPSLYANLNTVPPTGNTTGFPPASALPSA
jgi:hypothetical protein